MSVVRKEATHELELGSLEEGRCRTRASGDAKSGRAENEPSVIGRNVADWAILSGCAVGDKKMEMIESCELDS